jgi:hypothetical protein
MIMVRTFFSDDRADCPACYGVAVVEVPELSVKVSQHDGLYRNGSSRDGSATAQPGKKSQEQTSESAKMITSATT